MAVNQRLKRAYGFGQGIYDMSPDPIVAQRAPTIHDMAPLGTIWLNQSNSTAYTLIKVAQNQAIWGNQAVVGTNLANLTVNPGPTNLTGDVTVTSAVGSTVTINAGTGGATISTTGLVALTSSDTTGTDVSITATGAGGGIELQADTAGVTIANNNNGPFAVTTGTGAINLGTDAAAKTITIGNATGATSVVLNAGTGAVNIGSNAIAHATTVGSVTGGAATTLQSGTGGVTITSTATGTVAISANAAANTVNLGTGAAAKTVTLGSTTAGSTTTINSPATAGVQITSAATAAGIFVGTGNPNGSLTGTDGSIYLRTGTATASTVLYVCTGGTTWTAVTVP